jgi:3-methyladenine DNA glycosylase AlkC
MKTAVQDLAYYKENAEEDYLQVPISVLRYISQLEQDKKMYSEEEVLDILREFYKVSSKKDFPLTNTIPLWFEQLKNK